MDNTYGLAGLHEDLLDIMVFIHKLCLDNNIIYSLTGGSLLGAIRHGGFIPWDDDFDIMFDRDNFEKFISCMRNYDKDDYILEQDQWVYRIRKEHKTKGFIPSIDLFVLDKVPTNTYINKLQVLLLKVLQGMLRENQTSRQYSIFYKICINITSCMGKLFSKETLFKWYDIISGLGNSGKSNKLSIFDDRFHLISLKYDETLLEKVELHSFEGEEFYITTRYDEYLKLQFGDYMTPPPVEDRVPQHSI